MTLDELLSEIRRRRLLLISAEEVWPSELYTCSIRRAVKRHRKGLDLLIQWADIATCPDRGLHAPYYRHAGNGRYVCEVCAIAV